MAASWRWTRYVGQPYFLLAFAHRARAAALIRASPAGEMCRLGLALSVDEPPFRFAHLALCAAAIRLRAAVDMVRPERDSFRASGHESRSRFERCAGRSTDGFAGLHAR